MSPRVTRSSARKPPRPAMDESPTRDTIVVDDSQDDEAIDEADMIAAAAATNNSPTPMAKSGKRKAVGEGVGAGTVDVIHVNGSEDDELTPPKKRQKLTVRVKQTDAAAASAKPSTSPRKTPAKKAGAKIEVIIPTSSSHATARSRRGAGSSSGEDLAKDAKDEAAVPSTTPSTATPAPKGKGKRIIFDNDDTPAEFFTPMEAPGKHLLDAGLAGGAEKTHGDEEEDEEEDPDDEAPEAVSTNKPVEHIQKAERAAARAAEQQAAALKQKRRERDALFKQQAETRKKALVKAQKKAAAAASAAEDGGSDSDADASDEIPADKKQRRDTPGKISRKTNLLPLEFLESDEEGAKDAAAAGPPKPKKIKFNTAERVLARREGRAPQDQRVGSTVYRVLADGGDVRLAPKRRKHSVSLKKQLLKRNRLPLQQAGFFVKRTRV